MMRDQQQIRADKSYPQGGGGEEAPHQTLGSGEDYSQRRELRFMLLSPIWWRTEKKKARQGRPNWQQVKIKKKAEDETNIPLSPAAPALWVGGHRVAEDLLTSHFSWMEVSDAARTRLMEQGRRWRRQGRRGVFVGGVFGAESEGEEQSGTKQSARRDKM